LKKVEKLLEQGATVIGTKAERLVSLAGGQHARKNFHALADKLWGNNPAGSGENKIGKGRLIWGQSANEFLQSDGVPFDFEVMKTENQSDHEYIHYTIEGSDVYFVSNQVPERRTIDALFRVSGKQPELWNPVTGEITIANAFAQVDGRTIIPIELDPYGSVIVYFQESIPTSKQGSDSSNYPVLKRVKEIQGPWQVAFNPVWGGPESVVFETLTDWTQHADEGIKFYSGKATYINSFEFKPVEGMRYWLQLNKVKDAGIASVKLNGTDIGIAWTLPFRLNITDELRSGSNEIEITVANSWQNRLIGDRGKPQEERFTKTNIKVRDEWKLRESGLLGPVEIKSDLSVLYIAGTLAAK
jgi:hypothetical protein